MVLDPNVEFHRCDKLLWWWANKTHKKIIGRIEIDDLYQEFCKVFTESINRFDPEKIGGRKNFVKWLNCGCRNLFNDVLRAAVEDKLHWFGGKSYAELNIDYNDNMDSDATIDTERHAIENVYVSQFINYDRLSESESSYLRLIIKQPNLTASDIVESLGESARSLEFIKRQVKKKYLEFSRKDRLREKFGGF